jgi:hypothetical protein
MKKQQPTIPPLALYSVLKKSKQLFASKYKLYLPTEEELKNEVNEEIIKYNLYHRK